MVSVCTSINWALCPLAMAMLISDGRYQKLDIYHSETGNITVVCSRLNNLAIYGC
jgi:hypothetical protein